MATVQEIARLRRMVNEPTADTYSDADLSGLIDLSENLDTAAADIWQEKAAALAYLVNVSESGSSRNLSDLQKNALSLAASFRASGAEEVAVTEETASRTRVNKIVRT